MPEDYPVSISVVIPTYNSEEFVNEAIESAFRQDVQPLEVIVVDDGSTDWTPSVVEARWGNAVRLFRQENQGPSAARNRGVLEAKGQWIAFLDSDDVWKAGKLRKQAAYMAHESGVGLVFSDFEESAVGGQGRRSFFASKRYLSELRQGGLLEDLFRKLVDENFVPTSTVLVKRTCLEAVGLFDETLRSVEDRDLWLRLSLVTQFGCVPECLVRKRVHGANLSRDRWLALSGILKTLQKNQRLFPDALTKWEWEKALAKANLACGFYLLASGDCERARRMAENSWSHRPSLGALEVLLLCRLNGSLLNCALSLRHWAGRLRKRVAF